jgi:hypothetical protein
MQLKYMTERVAHSPPVATCMLSPLLRKLSDFGAFAFALALRSSDCSHALKREREGGGVKAGRGVVYGPTTAKQQSSVAQVSIVLCKRTSYAPVPSCTCI